jgi:hypothetical protein
MAGWNSDNCQTIYQNTYRSLKMSRLKVRSLNSIISQVLRQMYLGGVWCLNDVMFWALYPIGRWSPIQHILAPPSAPVTRRQESIVTATLKAPKQFARDTICPHFLHTHWKWLSAGIILICDRTNLYYKYICDCTTFKLYKLSCEISKLLHGAQPIASHILYNS